MYRDLAMLCRVYTCWMPARRSSHIWSSPICFSPWGFWPRLDDMMKAHWLAVLLLLLLLLFLLPDAFASSDEDFVSGDLLSHLPDKSFQGNLWRESNYPALLLQWRFTQRLRRLKTSDCLRCLFHQVVWKKKTHQHHKNVICCHILHWVQRLLLKSNGPRLSNQLIVISLVCQFQPWSPVFPYEKNERLCILFTFYNSYILNSSLVMANWNFPSIVYMHWCCSCLWPDSNIPRAARGDPWSRDWRDWLLQLLFIESHKVVLTK